MLSINIPVYNYCIHDLVAELISQANGLKIQFEIRIYDDGSSEDIKRQNRIIAEKKQIVYVELPENLGRAAIRNKMGLESKFENLLFIDADSMPTNKNYLFHYIQNISSGRVLCGGTAYKKEPPAEPEKYLRWYYGTNREAISAKIRNSKKGFIITSNNFLIEKGIFEKIHFREDVKKYGHEDTLLGYDLFKSRIDIFHINNPLEHTGLEDSSVFLEKTKTALKSLFDITKDLLADDPVFVKQVYFLDRFRAIKKIIPAAVLALFYRNSYKLIEKRLRGKHPNLLLFDLYKLGFYSTLK